MVPVGRVVRPQGNRGEVVIASDTDFGETRFAPGATVFRHRDGLLATLTVRESREQAGERWVVGFHGIDSIDEAETLRDVELRVPAEALQPLAEGTYYVHELLGCDVWTSSGTRIGSVGKVQVGVGVPMLTVEADGDEVLVPLVDRIIRKVDVGGRRIEIDPPDGLIDLNRRRGGAK